MAYWEFLLQKEGDRSWLPLESPNVEILEGRYRVVARTSRTNTNVEIRVAHLSTEEMPPKRRVQKRSHHTNADGLMVVFPFTRLKPGIWEITCVGDVMADLMGQGWKQSIQLQVLSQQQEAGDDWEPDWQQAEPAETSVPEAPQPETPVLAENPFQMGTAEAIAPPPAEPVAELEPNPWGDEPTPVPAVPTPVEPEEQPPIAPVVETPPPVVEPPATAVEPAALEPLETVLPTAATLQEMAATLLEDAWGTAEDWEDPTPAAAEAKPAPAVVASGGNQTWQLTLEQTNFVALWGQPLTLTGQIQVQNSEDSFQPSQSELQICLRDPQTLQVMGNAFQQLAIAAPTTSFVCTVEIPADGQTRLLLGEISLYNLGEDNEASLTPLALQTFTVSAALDELLGALPDLGEAKAGDRLSAPEPNLELYASPLGEVTETTDLSQLSLVFLDLLKAPRQSTPLQFQPTDSQPLPPQIYRPTVAPPATRSPQQPTFNQPGAITPPSPEEPLVPDTPPVESVELELPEVVAEELAPPVEEPVLEEPALAEPESAEIPAEDSEEGLTFRSLRLQERFWSRLNAIATDAELSAWLKAETPPDVLPDQPELSSSRSEFEALTNPAETFPGLSEVPPELPEELPVEPEDVWLAREIVVDDDLEELAPPIAATPAVPSVPVDLAPLSEEELVPMPELEVPEGELIAGKRLLVRVRLPEATSLTHVKLWINDRQTRSLMDGPRWVTDFIPNSSGVLETSVPLTVPFGSLEVQFEAIAVVLRNQRESRKVSISRAVVPPDLPTLSLDELDA